MKQIVLAAHPQGQPKPSDFRLEEVARPGAGASTSPFRTW